MATDITNHNRVLNVKNFVDSINTEEDMPRAYVFVGHPLPWENDNRPPIPDKTWREYYNTFDQMLSLKRVREIDCFPMINRRTWAQGVIYDIYRHDYTVTNVAHSGATKLYDAHYYVINQYNDIYVCLNNFFDRPSIDEPVAEGYEPFYTSDGYQWMKLYSTKSQILFDYSTNNFIPITTDGYNLDNYERTFGEVLTVRIDNRGREYGNPADVNSDGIINYYCKVVGDGSNAVANIRIANTEIISIRMVRFGEDYTFGELNFEVGKVYRSVADLDKNINAVNPRGDGTFRATVIIGPPGGWGTDIPAQLGAVRVGVFNNLSSNTNDFFSDATFRQIGLIHDPVFDKNTVGTAPQTLSACHAITTSEISGPESFIMGETVYQEYEEGETFAVRVAKATVVGWDEDTRILRYIIIPEISQDDADGQIYPFVPGGIITGMDSGKIVEPTSSNGSIDNREFINGYSQPEIQHDKGYMTYLANIPPVQREDTQSERVSLILQY